MRINENSPGTAIPDCLERGVEMGGIESSGGCRLSSNDFAGNQKGSVPLFSNMSAIPTQSAAAARRCDAMSPGMNRLEECGPTLPTQPSVALLHLLSRVRPLTTHSTSSFRSSTASPARMEMKYRPESNPDMSSENRSRSLFVLRSRYWTLHARMLRYSRTTLRSACGTSTSIMKFP